MNKRLNPIERICAVAFAIIYLVCCISPAWAAQRLYLDSNSGSLRTAHRAWSLSIDASNDWQFAGGDLVPSATNTYDLGTASKKWKALNLAGGVSAATATLTGNMSGTTATFTGRTYMQGGARLARTSVADDYQILATDGIVGVDSSAAIRTVTLPLAAACPTGSVLVVKDEGGAATTNDIVIEGNGAETIDGNANVIISTDDEAVRLYSNGVNGWYTW